MITLLEQPTGPLLSGNDIIYKVKATDSEGNPFRYTGARAELRAPAGTYLQETDLLFFFWKEPSGANGLALFTVSSGTAPPGASATYLPPPAGFPSALSQWEAIANIIGGHPRVFPLFEVYVTVNAETGELSLWYQAREYTEGWEITVGPDGEFSYTTYLYTDLSNNFLAAHRIILEVFIENTLDQGDYNRIAVLSTVAGANSQQSFNIAGVLHSGLRKRLTDLLIPNWSLAVPELRQTLRNFQVRITESSSEQGFNADSIYLDPDLVFFGGVSNSINIGNYLARITTQSSILSWRSKTQTVGYRQPYFISFYASNQYLDNVNESTLIYFAQVEEYDENGVLTDSRLEWRNQDAVAIEVPGIGTMPVGVDALSIAATTYYYRVKVVADNFGEEIEVTDWITFYVDRNFYPEERYLAYLNSFGAPEILRCTGNLSKEVKIDAEVSQHVRQGDAAGYYASSRKNRVQWEDIFTYNSAFVDEIDKDAIEHEINISENIYEISPVGFIPLRTIGKSFSISNTEQNLHQVQVKAVPAAMDGHYSRVDGEILEPPIEAWGSPDGIGLWATSLVQVWAT